MEQDILTELKKINTQLGQLVQLLRVGQPKARQASFGVPADIASEVQRQIADARRKAEETMSSFHSILPSVSE